MNVTFTIHNDRKSLHFAGNFSSELRPFSKYAKEISDIEVIIQNSTSPFSQQGGNLLTVTNKRKINLKPEFLLQ